jgi:hypothetical protein
LTLGVYCIKREILKNPLLAQGFNIESARKTWPNHFQTLIQLVRILIIFDQRRVLIFFAHDRITHH